MREQVEMLEHHADFAPDFVDLLEIVGKLDPIDDDPARLMLLETVDAADERRLARPRGPANDDPFAAIDREIDVAQDVEVAIPLVHSGNLDRRFVGNRGILADFGVGHCCPLWRDQRRWVVVSCRSMNCEYRDIRKQNIQKMTAAAK